MIENIYIEPRIESYKQLCQRPKKDKSDLEAAISNIFQKVKTGGDKALYELTKQFDKVALSSLKVADIEIVNAEKVISEDLKEAIKLAKENITKFHKAQISDDVIVDTMEGVRCIQKSIGIDRVGIYIPGGTAPLFSTVLMLAIPAALAGCKDIVLCTPPDEVGKVNPAILFAAQLCGVNEIYKVGGAQAIAAMALGTDSIPSVNKIFGPGNQYVTAAKQYAQNFGVGMDLPAGPSELLVYASETAIPKFVAADLLSQAEHGADSQVILVAKSKSIAHDVNAEVLLQVQKLPREEIALQALKNSKTLIISDENEAFNFINTYGPEHLIIAADNYNEIVGNVSNAGSVFLGNYCPESAGDYASGTNHTLPTDGWAKSYNGVNVDSFCRKITFQEISKIGIRNLGNAVIEMATQEQLIAHANAITVRLEAIENKTK